MTKKPIDIDAEFDDVYFDEQSIRRSTAALIKAQDPEYKKRHKESMDKVRENPEYHKKLSEAQKRLSLDPEIKERRKQVQKELRKNPDYQKNYIEAMERLKSNEEWRKNQRAASDVFRNDPQFKERKRKEMLDNMSNPEFQKKRLEGHKKALANPTWIENVKASKVKFRKKIQTPDGIFDSRKAAADFYNIDPTQINSRIKKWPDKYYYIKN